MPNLDPNNLDQLKCNNETWWFRALVFLAGFLFPLMYLSQTQLDLGDDVWSVGMRVTPVDVVLVILLLVLVARRAVTIRPPATAYAIALGIALCITVLRTETSGIVIMVGFAALFVAWLYLLLGYALGSSPELLRTLVLGVAGGVVWESVIIGHDYFSGTQWFPDPLLGRVRGTFRLSSQLGQFGFSAAGLLLTMGWLSVRSARARAFIIGAGLLAVLLVIVSSRRLAIVALGCWLAGYLLTGKRNIAYYWVCAGSVLALVLGWCWQQELSESFFWHRMMQAVVSADRGDSFVQDQFTILLNRAGDWFPLGIGLGKDYTDQFLDGYEIHSAHLAVAVELGLLGSIAFYCILLHPVLVRLRDGYLELRVAQQLLATFLIAGVVLMVHATLHRDRLFLVVVGVGTSMMLRAASTDSLSQPIS